MRHVVVTLCLLFSACEALPEGEDTPDAAPGAVDASTEADALVLETPEGMWDENTPLDYCGHPPQWALNRETCTCNLYNGGECFACTLYNGGAPIGTVEGHCDEVPCCNWGTPSCRSAGVGVLIGDSIVVPLQFQADAHALLIENGDTTVRLAAGGHTTAMQLAAWQASPERANPNTRWVFIQVGVNDIGGGKLPADIVAGIAALKLDVETSTPWATVVIAEMLPACGFPGFTATQCTRWYETNALLVSHLGALQEARIAMDDGTGKFKPGLSDDGLHPNPTGTFLLAQYVALWRDAYSGSVCE